MCGKTAQAQPALIHQPYRLYLGQVAAIKIKIDDLFFYLINLPPPTQTVLQQHQADVISDLKADWYMWGSSENAAFPIHF